MPLWDVLTAYTFLVACQFIEASQGCGRFVPLGRALQILAELRAV
jgi:hypothetical protein